jgi:hypothetical protein
MEERLTRLKSLLEELKENCYADQYGIADWVETNKSAKLKMEKLSSESYFYQKTIDTIKSSFS